MMTETAMRHLFVQFDSEGSGNINYEQFHLGFQKLGLVDVSKSDVDHIIKKTGS